MQTSEASPSTTNHNGAVHDWLAAALEEHRALREEIITSLQLQHSAVRFGFTAASALLTVAVSLWRDAYVALFVLFSVPVFVSFILNLWCEEVARLMRAGRHIRSIEQKVNEQFDGASPPMGWETALAASARRLTSHRRLRPNTLSTLGLFALLALGSLIVANVRGSRELHPAMLIALDVAVIATCAAIVAAVLKSRPEAIMRRDA